MNSPLTCAGRLTSEERRSYERDGFFVRRAVLLEEELEALRAAAERTAMAAATLAVDGHTYCLDGKRFVDVGHVTVQFEHTPGSNAVRVVEPAHALDADWDALLDDMRLVAPMRDLIGSERLAIWTCKLNMKPPQEGSGFGWHQDSPYWIHDSDDVDRLPNVMVALDDASEENGCLRFIRGSHRHGCLPGTDDGTQLGGFFTNPACIDASREVCLEISAGSLIFFSPHIVHGSLPNRSAQPRRAFIATYQTADRPMLKIPAVRNVPAAPDVPSKPPA